MQPVTSKVNAEFQRLMVEAYANIAILELRLYNDQPDSSRPTFKESLYLFAIQSMEKCTASDLVALFNSSKALVSQTVISMEEKGFIVRTKDPKDNRRQIITLSPEKNNETQIERAIADEAIRRLNDKFSDEDIIRSARVMYEISEVMKDVVMEQFPITK